MIMQKPAKGNTGPAPARKEAYILIGWSDLFHLSVLLPIEPLRLQALGQVLEQAGNAGDL